MRTKAARNLSIFIAPFVGQLILLCDVSQAVTITGELVTNGNAETGDLAGWTTANGMEIVTDPGAAVRGTGGLSGSTSIGDFSFWGGTGATPATATQSIDLTPFSSDIDSGSQVFSLGVALQSRSASGTIDLAIARFTFRDGTASVLGSPVVFQDSHLPTNNFDWTEFSLQSLVPVGARSLAVEIESNRNSGSSSNGYIDNVSFSLVPEPSAILLIGVGSVTLLAWRFARRRRFTSRRTWA